MILTALRERRIAAGWSQDELAAKAGLSRPAVSAIETSRVVPSVAAALALAAVFGCTVEDLFRCERPGRDGTRQWAWPPAADPVSFWEATVGERTLLYPFEPTLVGIVPTDGRRDGAGETRRPAFDPQRTLVVASCDPAIGLLAAELRGTASLRLLPVVRSSRKALELLGRDLVHVAGLHLQGSDDAGANERVVREMLGGGFTLVHVSRWQEGVALRAERRFRTVEQVLRAKLRWVGREEGSGARRCLDALLGGRARPVGYDYIAHDHTGVGETLRSGWAQAGICLRLVAEMNGLDFLPVQQEDYDFCYRSDREDDPRIQALLAVVGSRSYRRQLGDLPGYDSAQAGALLRIGG